MSAATAAPSQQGKEPLFDDNDRVVFRKDVGPNPKENNLKNAVPKGSNATVTSSMPSKGTFWYNLRIDNPNDSTRSYTGFHIEEEALDFHPDKYKP